jgi:hypothetical protein
MYPYINIQKPGYNNLTRPFYLLIYQKVMLIVLFMKQEYNFF